MGQHPVYDVAIISPLEKAAGLSRMLGANIYLKREDLQSVHSFKLRGAYNKIVGLSDVEKSKGIIAASAGNHAQGVALAAQKLGLSAIIVMPETAPMIKIDAVEDYGARVELHGDNYSEAYEYCMKRVAETGMTFIHPFDDIEVIDGQGTVGTEIIDQLQGVTHIFVPIGGGGLIAGVAKAAKSVRSDIKIIGVEPDDSAAMHDSLEAGKRITLSHVGIFADGVAVKQIGELTFDLTKKYVDEVITVSTDQICAGIKTVFEETRSIMEPAGALAVTGVISYTETHDMKGQHVVAICSGANTPFERLQYIAERTLVGSGSEALFAVVLREGAGSLLEFYIEVINGFNITEFNYRLHRRDKAQIFVGIGALHKLKKEKLVTAMIKHDYEFTDLTDDEIAGQHLRHMIGGPSSDTQDEHIYAIDFPEKPGALGDFLSKVSNRGFNISLLHYRGQGGDVGNVLIGLEGAVNQIEKLLDATKFEYTRAPASLSLFL